MDQPNNHLAFNIVMNSGIFNKYQKECDDLLTEFLKILHAAEETTIFLHSKAPSNKKIYYMTALHVRAIDHFSSCIVLMSQGYVVDAYSLARSALEDLLVIVNFEIDKDYFNRWQQNGKRFKISPGQLRDNIKRHPELNHLYDFFARNYARLSNLLHPKKTA